AWFLFLSVTRIRLPKVSSSKAARAAGLVREVSRRSVGVSPVRVVEITRADDQLIEQAGGHVILHAVLCLLMGRPVTSYRQSGCGVRTIRSCPSPGGRSRIPTSNGHDGVGWVERQAGWAVDWTTEGVSRRSQRASAAPGAGPAPTTWWPSSPGGSR